METFSNRLKFLLDTLSITQSKLASDIGVSKQVIGNWLNKGYSPDSSALINFNFKYNINLNWLLTGKGAIYISDSESDKDKLIKEYQNVLLEKENQLTRVREAVGFSESRAKTINTAAKVVAAKLVKGNPGRAVKRK